MKILADIKVTVRAGSVNVASKPANVVVTIKTAASDVEIVG